MNMMKMMQEAKRLQERLQRELGELEVSASAGGGVVEATMNGHKRLLRLRIDSSAIGSDQEMLQDLIVAAVNQAGRKVDDAAAQRLGGLAGGLGLPPL
ncbi:MAG TPA: YbaB/EbfC family nucleoid-associated protein [Acidobacteriota bacterium]